MNKNILLVIALLIIGGSIWYLQSGKVRPDVTVRGDVLTDIPTTPTVDTSTNTTLVGATSTGGRIPTAPTSKLVTTTATPTTPSDTTSSRKAQKAKKFKPAREITPGGGFINSDPFKLKDYIGKKVILLDFWTYSCINCQRTTPYLNAWYQKYKDQGLVIVGMHTPEFDFEKVYDNVAKAVKDEGIKYPVVQDNNYATWQTYQNQFWPRKYLIDIDGYIVYDHIGEGGYEETEEKIQQALTERAQILGSHDAVSSGIVNPQDVVAISGGALSPETYFGAGRNNYLGNGTQNAQGIQALVVPKDIAANTLYLGGSWKFTPEYTESQAAHTSITYRFQAKDVYFVASAASGVTLTLTIDGKPIGVAAGADVKSDGTVIVKDNRLYKLVHMPEYGEHTLQIDVGGAGLDAYTFTFG